MRNYLLVMRIFRDLLDGIAQNLMCEIVMIRM